MSSTKAAGPEIRELIHTLAEKMNSAQGGYEVWYTLTGKDKGYEQYSAELQGKYSDFFQLVRNAHFKVMFIDIACLFDLNPKTSSFHKLKELLRNDGYDDTAKRIECSISSHKHLIDSIRKGYRNKRIAHYETAYTEEQILKECGGVTPNDIRLLLKTFNKLLVAVFKGVVSPNDAYPIACLGRFEEATFQLLHDLESARKSEKMTTCSP